MEITELNALQAAAAAADAENNPQQMPETPEQPTQHKFLPNPTLAAELSGYITMFVKVFSPALPSLLMIYTPEVVAAVADSTATVCTKHGWLQDGIGGKYAEEIALAGLVIPLGMATHSAVKNDIAALKAKAEAKEKTIEPATT